MAAAPHPAEEIDSDPQLGESDDKDLTGMDKENPPDRLEIEEFFIGDD